MIKNYSRHKFNIDQKNILNEIGYKYNDEVLNTFFQSAIDFARQTNGEVCSLVAPLGIVLECIAMGEQYSSRILVWKADKNARNRNHFAVRGVTIFNIHNGSVYKTGEVAWTPTVENDCQSGEEFLYGGE